MSRPTTAFFDLPRPNTGYVLTEPQTRAVRKADTRTPRLDRAVIPAALGQNTDLLIVRTSPADYNCAGQRQKQPASDCVTSRSPLSARALRLISGSATVCHTLDSAQKGSYDLGLPLPGPAPLFASPGGKSPNIG